MKNRQVLVTTSWDDGHPLDFRLAEMLDAHGLAGTFYIPRESQLPTMDENAIRQLGTRFEVGAHTLNHVYLPDVPRDRARQEIQRSKDWLESVTGQECTMFCFPGGKFNHQHLEDVRDAGFLAARTTELLNTSLPHKERGVLVMPTTLQAHPHEPKTYLKNTVKRRSVSQLLKYVSNGWRTDWVQLGKSLMAEAADNHGVFHIWGHSWEIDQHNQWGALAEFLAFLGQFSGSATFMSNTDVCRYSPTQQLMSNQTDKYVVA